VIDIEHQRSENQTHRVVHEKRRQHSGDSHDAAQQQQWPVRMPHHPGAHQREEPGEPQVGYHDHHAEQQNDGVIVDSRYACWSVTTLAATIRLAPMIATPVRSTRNQGRRPRASAT